MDNAQIEQRRLLAAGMTFVTAFDECRQKGDLLCGGMPESLFWLALGGRTSDFTLVRKLVYLGIVEQERGHILKIGPRGEALLAEVRKLQEEGKLDKNL